MGGGDFKREDFVGTFKVEILFFFSPDGSNFFFNSAGESFLCLICHVYTE